MTWQKRPLRVIPKEDYESAVGLRGEAQKQLALMHRLNIHNLHQFGRTVTYQDGTTIECRKVFGQDTITITVPFKPSVQQKEVSEEKNYLTMPYGILIRTGEDQYLFDLFAFEFVKPNDFVEPSIYYDQSMELEAFVDPADKKEYPKRLYTSGRNADTGLIWMGIHERKSRNKIENGGWSPADRTMRLYAYQPYEPMDDVDWVQSEDSSVTKIDLGDTDGSWEFDKYGTRIVQAKAAKYDEPEVQVPTFTRYDYTPATQKVYQWIDGEMILVSSLAAEDICGSIYPEYDCSRRYSPTRFSLETMQLDDDFFSCAELLPPSYDEQCDIPDEIYEGDFKSGPTVLIISDNGGGDSNESYGPPYSMDMCYAGESYDTSANYDVCVCDLHTLSSTNEYIVSYYERESASITHSGLTYNIYSPSDFYNYSDRYMGDNVYYYHHVSNAWPGGAVAFDTFWSWILPRCPEFVCFDLSGASYQWDCEIYGGIPKCFCTGDSVVGSCCQSECIAFGWAKRNMQYPWTLVYGTKSSDEEIVEYESSKTDNYTGCWEIAMPRSVDPLTPAITFDKQIAAASSGVVTGYVGGGMQSKMFLALRYRDESFAFWVDGVDKTDAFKEQFLDRFEVPFPESNFIYAVVFSSL